MAKAKIDHFETEHGKHHDSALIVNDGVEQPPVVNPAFKKPKRRELTAGQYMEGILGGDISILARAITLIESSNPDHHALASEIISRCLPHAGRSKRIGITGVPGAGKSTFIEAIGNRATAHGNRLAVLAIDPSSERSKGSILGDKTRMESLSGRTDVFIRPSPSAGSLGGVARRTRETVILCEAAGYDTVFIETVGVGQSETAVHSMADLFLLLQISGAGDELQGIKRGIMEMADMVVITKADGDNIDRARLAEAQITSALRLFPEPDSGIRPTVCTTSSLTGEGLESLWTKIDDWFDQVKANDWFNRNRARQNKYWMYKTIEEELLDRFYRNPAVESALPAYEERVARGEVSSFEAARQLLELK